MPEKNPKKNQGEKPTPEQLKKVKKSPKPEKKEPWRYPIEPEEKEDISTGSRTEEKESQEVEEGWQELEEICGNLWVVLYQLGGILKKGFEPLTDDVKKLISPPSARIAVKYNVQDAMKDEYLLLAVLGVDISKRLIVKKPKKGTEDSKEEEKK